MHGRLKYVINRSEHFVCLYQDLLCLYYSIAKDDFVRDVLRELF